MEARGEVRTMEEAIAIARREGVIDLSGLYKDPVTGEYLLFGEPVKIEDLLPRRMKDRTLMHEFSETKKVV
jgi:threonine dehydrogenase-like Zn-dependent dehydrogenase